MNINKLILQAITVQHRTVDELVKALKLRLSETNENVSQTHFKKKDSLQNTLKVCIKQG